MQNHLCKNQNEISLCKLALGFASSLSHQSSPVLAVELLSLYNGSLGWPFHQERWWQLHLKTPLALGMSVTWWCSKDVLVSIGFSYCSGCLYLYRVYIFYFLCTHDVDIIGAIVMLANDITQWVVQQDYVVGSNQYLVRPSKFNHAGRVLLFNQIIYRCW